MNDENTKITFWVCTLVIATNLSQLPFFVNNGITQFLSYPAWILIAIFAVLHHDATRKYTIHVLIFFICFCMVSLLQELLTGFNYLGSRIFQSVMLTVWIFSVSSLIPGKLISVKTITSVYTVYILSATAVAVAVYYSYFYSIQLFTSPIYEYGSKNSTSQILLTAIILGIFCINDGGYFIKRAKWCCLGINLVLLFLIRSRASIIGLVVLIAAALQNKSLNSKTKLMIMTAVAIFGVLICFNAEVYNVIVEKILFGFRSVDDLDSLSSGRLGQLEEFPELFEPDWMFGKGRYKIESFPLSVLVQYGLFTGMAIIIFCLQPVIYAIKRRKQNREYDILLVLSLVYLLNGLFEELSPLGPGVKCYFLWFLFGILIGREDLPQKNSNSFIQQNL